jgi:WD40 repeat protein
MKARMTSAHVAALREQVEEHLRMADARRFGQLLELFAGDRLRLSDVLKSFYPRMERDTQLSQLRNFRTELNRAFRDAKLDVAFVVDTRKRSAPEERFCWFEGENAAGPLLTGFVERQAHVTDPAKSVEPRGTLTPARRPVRYVVVSSEKDEPAASEFIELLRVRMFGSRFTAFDGWAPADLVAGENRAAEQQKHEEASQIVIVLMSPSLVADKRIRERIARLKDEGRPLFPIPLSATDADRQDLGPLQGLERCPREMRAFRDLRGKPAKEKFALAAWQDIEGALEKLTLRSTSSDVALAPAPSSLLDSSIAKAWNLPGHVLDARARLQPLHLKGGVDDRFDLERGGAAGSQPRDESIDAVKYLQAWAIDPDAPPFFALLGDVGIGKTTTCRLLTLRMLEARNGDPAAPLPIYLDLRRFSWDGSTRFSLDSILDEVLRKSFHAGTSPLPSPRDVIEHVQRQGAVVLFDGLDEVIVHMPPKLGQDFIRELWRILPPTARKSEGASVERRGKLLISCRSHYFRRVWEQNTMLFGEEREGLRSSDYRALVLLPFDSAQVEEYLRHNVAGLDVERALALIRSIHNLSELAERPFTLSLIGEFLPDLERESRSGATIQGVDLYEAMVTRWLLRDQGKHQFNTVHKELLMERLAAALWSGAQRQWSFEQLENWLDDTVDGDDRFRAYRGKEREVLKEDLRTATFLVRPGAETFRFAHTSLQEFFLARHLYRALNEGVEDRWTVAMPSDETFEFLVQLVNRGGEQKQIAQRTLGEILGRYRPLASEAALRFWMRSRTKPGGLQRPDRIDLGGAKLNGWQFIGSQGRPLDFRSVDLRHAELRSTTFRIVDLSGADLSGAKAARAEFHDVTSTGSNFGGESSARTDLTGSLWRTCQLANVDLRYADIEGSRFIRCNFSHVSWPASGVAPILAACHDETGEKSTLSRRADTRLDAFTGHGDRIQTCTISPDGRRIIASSSDGVLRVWDAITGEVQMILDGHCSTITACAMSSDGRRLVAGAEGGELRIWDVASGKVLLSIDGHRGAVLACALSADGSRIYSGTDTHTLCVFDARDGRELLTCQSHDRPASACGMSHDGRFIVFGSEDGTLRVQDGTSGAVLRVLKGHTVSVESCSFSADGGRIVSTARDGGFRVWETQGGKVLFAGNGQGLSAVISPDGRRVLTVTIHTVSIQDATSGDILHTFPSTFWGVGAFTASGERIVLGSWLGTLSVWDAVTGAPLMTLRSHLSRPQGCAMSPDGSEIVTGSSVGRLCIWNSESGELSRTLDRAAWSCTVSLDGRRIISGSVNGTVRVWDAATRDLLRTYVGAGSAITNVLISPDYEYITAVTFQNTACIWDANIGKVRMKFDISADDSRRVSLLACAMSPDKRSVVAARSDGTLSIRALKTGAVVRTVEEHAVPSSVCAVSPDGLRLVFGGMDGTLPIIDLTSNKLLFRLRDGEAATSACAISPGGRHILSGARDGWLRLWNGVTGKLLLTLAGHHGRVVECALSADGRRLFSAASDGTMCVWDGASGTLLLTIARLDDDETVVFDEVPTRRIRRVTPGAWRWLGWLAEDPETGAVRRYPAESFGPLPGAEREA